MGSEVKRLQHRAWGVCLGGVVVGALAFAPQSALAASSAPETPRSNQSVSDEVVVSSPTGITAG
ncbi:MAG: hypothetical protein ACTJHU_08225, partial [Mycetocola sp.]